MTEWKEYVLTVVMVSISCGIVMQMTTDTSRKELMHIICGVVIAGIILQPISQIRISDILKLGNFDPESAEQYLTAGEITAATMKKQYITEACEAYIWNKAQSMGTEIKPVILLDEACMPAYADIYGTLDSQTQEKLELILLYDLGITKENQQWTGNP